MASEPFSVRRWSRREYERLVECGVVHEDEPVELIGGHLVVAEPKGSPHATAVALVAQALREAFGPGWLVRVQDPVALDEDSEPEPDVVVVPGTPRDYRDRHPSRPALVVEVADVSLAFDRRRKGSLYARAGVEDYWIANLVDRVLEVARRPGVDPSAEFGWRYHEVTVHEPAAVVSPLARPGVGLRVADLLP